MAFDFDGTGIKDDGGYHLLPAGRYCLEIIKTVESKTKKAGYPAVVVDYRVVGGEYNNRKVRFHWIVFLPPDNPGAGIAIKYLKTIDQPYQGKLRVCPEDWRGSLLIATLAVELDNKNIERNVVKYVDPMPDIDGTEDELDKAAKTNAPKAEETPDWVLPQKS